MAYDEHLVKRLRKVLRARRGLVEKKMFGGVAFMVRGNMCCGVSGTELMLRVGPGGYADALSQPHARPMDFTGKPMKGFVTVSPAGFESDPELHAWVDRALQFVRTLPTKATGSKAHP